jgi:hypothetical protein
MTQGPLSPARGFLAQRFAKGATHLFENLKYKLLFHLLGDWDGNGFFLCLCDRGRGCCPPMLGIQFSKRHLGLPMTIEAAADLRETLGDVILALAEPS